MKNLPVAVLVGSEVDSFVVISNGVGVVVCWWDIGVNRGGSISWGRCVSRGRCVCWGRCVLGSSRGDSHKSEQSNKALKKTKK